MEKRGGFTQEERESNIHGSGTLESPFRPDDGEWLYDHWLKCAANNKRVKHCLVSGETAYLQSAAGFEEKFGVRLTETDQGLGLEVEAILEPNDKKTGLSISKLENLMRVAKGIHKIFSKQLLNKSWFKLF